MNRRCFLRTSLAMLVVACSHAPTSKAQKIPPNSTVLALGDSLTFGYGASSDAAYPQQLAQLTAWRVINGGVSGDTSAQALARLPTLLKQHQPKLVLLGIGGNDFLRGIPESQTHQHISQMVQMIQAQNREVVLIAIPQPSLTAAFGSLSDHALYASLAKQHRVPLLEEAWSDILSDKKLKSDAIHANAQGYRIFAEKMADFLRKQGFL